MLSPYYNEGKRYKDLITKHLLIIWRMYESKTLITDWFQSETNEIFGSSAVYITWYISLLCGNSAVTGHCLWSAVYCTERPISTGQCSAGQCRAVYGSLVQGSAGTTVQGSEVQCSALHGSAVQGSAWQCCSVQCRAMKCRATQCSSSSGQCSTKSGEKLFKTLQGEVTIR